MLSEILERREIRRVIRRPVRIPERFRKMPPKLQAIGAHAPPQPPAAFLPRSEASKRVAVE